MQIRNSATALAPVSVGQQADAPRLGRHVRRAALHVSLALQGAGRPARRVIDITLMACGILALSPLLIATAFAVKLTSPGPLFFGQERIGQGGRRFMMWKFRTMVQNADKLKDELEKAHADAKDGVRFKMVRDPRITPVGRVLRKLSIDELPQLWNVLRGDMTLVGPRPPVWREVALYDSRALRRLEVRPGLTCLWQVMGRSDLSFEQQVDLDIEYIDRVKAHQELGILAKTLPAVLSGRGAY